MGTLLQVTSTVPIVFTQTADPVGGGLVASLAQPGGNATGFAVFDYDMGGKWLELLKEIAPRVTRAAVLRDPAISQGIGQFGAIQSVAPSLGVAVSPVNIRDAGEIERVVTAFARGSNGGLIVTGSGLAIVHRELIITLAARHKLPAVYFQRGFVTAGGLSPMGLIRSTRTGARRLTSTASSRVRDRPTCRCRVRQNTTQRSISRLPKLSA